MRMILIVCLFLFGCSTIPNYKQKEFLDYVKEQGVILESGQITNAEYVKRLDAKRIASVGALPDDNEVFAYMAVLAQKRDAGEITKEEARYLVVMKQNEIRERNAKRAYQQQELAIQQGTLGLGLINAGAPRTLNSNQINCQSYRTGTITNTSCQ